MTTVKQRTVKAYSLALLLALVACAGFAATGCEDDGVTAACDPQPIVDENGKPVDKDSKWNTAPGEGGALNRWALANPDCATLPVAGSRN